MRKYRLTGVSLAALAALLGNIIVSPLRATVIVLAKTITGVRQLHPCLGPGPRTDLRVNTPLQNSQQYGLDPVSDRIM